MSVEPEVLVGLVGEDHEVGGDRLPREAGQLHPGEDCAGRVVWRVDDQHPAARGDARPQGHRIGSECPRDGWDTDTHSTREIDGRGVQVEPGLEDQHLVPGLHERQDAGDDGLRGPGGHHHVRGRVPGQPVPRLLMRTDRPPKLGQPVRRWVLRTSTLGDRSQGGVAHEYRAIGVRVSLAEIDRPDRGGQGRHLAEDAAAMGLHPPHERVGHWPTPRCRCRRDTWVTSRSCRTGRPWCPPAGAVGGACTARPGPGRCTAWTGH